MAIISLLAFLGIAAGFSSFGRLPSHVSYTMAASIIILVGFFMGVINLFQSSMICIGLGGIFLLTWLIWQTIVGAEKSLYKVPWHPFFIFYGLLILSYPWLEGLVFIYNDEFSHWGLVLRNMVLQQSLITSDSVVNFYSYPPGASIFQYFIVLFKGYNEGLFYLANLLLIISLTSAFAPKAYDSKGLVLPVIAMGVMIGLTALHYNVFSLYVDVLLALFFGATIISYLSLKNDAQKRFYALLPLMVLPLLKPAGLLFALFALLLIIGFELRRLFSKNSKALTVLVILSFLCAPFLSQGAFKYYLSTLPNIEKPHSPEEQYNDFFASYADGNITESQKETIKNFKKAFFEKRIVDSGGSAFEMMLLILGISAIACLMHREPKVKVELGIVTGYMWSCSFLYLGLILFLYLTSMSDYEAARLASYRRYTDIYFLPWLLITLYYLLQAFYTQTTRGGLFYYVFQRQLFLNVFYIISFTVSAIFCLGSLHENIQQRDDTGYIPRIKHIKSLAKEVKEHIEPDAKIFVMWQHTHGYDIRAFSHYMAPEYISDGYSLGAPYGAKDIWTRKDEHADLMQWLDGYNYLVVAHSNRSFWEKYADYFAPDIMREVFTVCHANDKIGEASKQLLFEIRSDGRNPRLALKAVLQPNVGKILPRTGIDCETH